MNVQPPGPRLLERLWSLRYARPGSLEVLPTLPDSPEKAVLEAMLAWRGQRVDEALALLQPVVAPGVLDDRWAARALDLQAAALQELGLTEEAVTVLATAEGHARAADDAISLASIAHDLGVAYSLTDPDRGAEHFRRAIALARRFRDLSTDDDRESCALEALAIVNLYDLEGSKGDRVAPEVPGLVAAERLALRGWPELAAHVRAVRVLRRLDEGDVPGATELAATLPDPVGMRDVTNAVTVARAQARLAALQGRPTEGRRVLEGLAGRVTDPYRIELLDDLTTLLTEEGEHAAATAVARERAELILRTHLAESRRAVRALEVWHRTHRAEDDARAAEAQAEALRSALEELHEHQDRLREISTRDPLTGLSNRVHLWDTYGSSEDLEGAQVALLDLDAFKAVNDSFGHVVGDAALRRVAAALRAACGPLDLCARYGGDELVVVRPPAVEGSLATSLRPVVRLAADRGGVPVRCSIGVTTLGPGEDLQAGLDRADRLMYLAKRRGGAQVQTDLP